AAIDQLLEHRQCDPSVRVGKQPAAVGPRGGLRKLVLASLLDDSVEELQRSHGLLKADRISDLDRRGQRWTSLDRLEVVVTVLIDDVERICLLGLGYYDPRQLLNQPEVSHHQKP